MVKYNRIRKKIKPTGRSERPPRPRIKAGKAVRKFRPYGSIFARTAVPAVQIQEFPPKKGDYGLFAAAHRSSRPLGVSRLRVVACGDRTASAVQIQEFFTKKATTGCSPPLTGQAGRSAFHACASAPAATEPHLRFASKSSIPIEKGISRSPFLLVGDYGFEPQTLSV